MFSEIFFFNIEGKDSVLFLFPVAQIFLKKSFKTRSLGQTQALMPGWVEASCLE